MKTCRLVLLIAAACGLASPAAAQIYAWRDARGVLHLSDRPRESPARTWPVARASDIVVTRPAAPGSSVTFDPIIRQAAADYRVSPDLVRAVVQVESGFNPRARSPKGAMGLMQLMPATAAELGVDDPFDPEQNVRGGVTYLRQLLDRYDDNERLALAAYNAGPEAVARHGNQVPPYAETRSYVQRITNRPGARAGTAGRTVIYKTIEIIDGRPVPRYSAEKPASGPYEIVDVSR